MGRTSWQLEGMKSRGDIGDDGRECLFRVFLLFVALGGERGTGRWTMRPEGQVCARILEEDVIHM